MLLIRLKYFTLMAGKLNRGPYHIKNIKKRKASLKDEQLPLQKNYLLKSEKSTLTTFFSVSATWKKSF